MHVLTHHYVYVHMHAYDICRHQIPIIGGLAHHPLNGTTTEIHHQECQPPRGGWWAIPDQASIFRGGGGGGGHCFTKCRLLVRVYGQCACVLGVSRFKLQEAVRRLILFFFGRST